MTPEKLNELLDLFNQIEHIKRCQCEIYKFVSTGKGDFNDPAKRNLLKLMGDLDKVVNSHSALMHWDWLEGVRELIETNILNKIFEFDEKLKELEKEFEQL